MSRDRFLAASVDLFEDTGEFPTIKLVQRELAGWHHEGISARREAERLPPSLGEVEGDRVRLGVRAIHRMDPGSMLLINFHSALRVAVTRYRRRDRKTAATISVADLIKQTGMSELEAGQAMRLLSAERFVQKVGKGAWEVLPAVRHYRLVREIEDYLGRKRKFERRQCRRRTFSKPVDFVKGLRGVVRAAAVSALAAILVALAILVGNFLVGDPDETAPGHGQGGVAKQRSGP